MTDAAYYGTLAVKLILAAIALWLYIKAIAWTGARLALAAEQQRRVDDLEWYVAVAQYLELRERNASKGRIPVPRWQHEKERLASLAEPEAIAFALDFPGDEENDILMAQLRKSVRPNDAA